MTWTKFPSKFHLMPCGEFVKIFNEPRKETGARNMSISYCVYTRIYVCCWFQIHICVYINDAWQYKYTIRINPAAPFGHRLKGRPRAWWWQWAIFVVHLLRWTEKGTLPQWHICDTCHSGPKYVTRGSGIGDIWMSIYRSWYFINIDIYTYAITVALIPISNDMSVRDMSKKR